MERFACPTPDFRQRYRCIDDTSLCDGFFDCPGQEDENPDQCLFYKTVSNNFDLTVVLLCTTSPSDKKYGFTLPTNYESTVLDTDKQPKHQIEVQLFRRLPYEM